MFDSYTGLSSSDYPYFNYKNVTHPSYQVHPYVWNFVEKNKETVNSLLTVFYSAAVDDLEMHRISLCCDAYYGEYGQPIDRWRFPDTLDYTGYTTEYESGDHIQQDTGIYSEVVDYTGMFYPPAVEYLSANAGYFDRCVMSIRDAETKKSTKTFIVKQLSGNIIDHIDVKTEKTAGIPAYNFVSPEKTFSRISAAMRYYAVDDQTVKDAISGYFSALDSASWTASGCADAVVSAIPETFYGMFYRHLSWNREQYEIQRDWVADQLEEYWSGDGSVTRISDIMKPAPLSD